VDAAHSTAWIRASPRLVGLSLHTISGSRRGAKAPALSPQQPRADRFRFASVVTESGSPVGGSPAGRGGWSFVRLSRKPERLYESYKRDFGRPCVRSCPGQIDLMATEMTWSRIADLSQMHKNWIRPRVCATASRQSSSN
jgi:hypothetical protein